jgi:preprotein translocase subunit SecB
VAASSRFSPARDNRAALRRHPAPKRSPAASVHPETAMAADPSTLPTLNIQRIYLKDLSLEQPNSPKILLEQGQPQVEINLGVGAEPIAEAMYEVTLTATVTTKLNDKTLFLVEAKQGGIFEIKNVSDEQLKQALGVICPNTIYPYLRAIVSDVCTRAGFPPVVLSEFNFQAMYEAQKAQALAQGAANATNGSGIVGTAG